MADHFCLRWNNYQSNMVSELDILRTEEHLVDVTLSCEGQKFRAHKVILSACSAYFRNVFKENPCEHPVVILKDVNHEDVEALLTFIYQGVVYVSEKKLASFLQTAELLQIKGLTGAASTFKEEQSSLLSDKGPPPPLTPTKPVSLPARKLLPSVSPPSVKRRKGAPVRICKSNDGGEGSDTNSNQGGDDDSQPLPVKQENIEDNDTARQDSPPDEMFDDEISREGLSFEESPRGEGEVDSNEGSASVYASVDMADGEEDGEIKREETTLLERSLVGAGVSRPLDVQNSFPTYPVPVPGQGLSEQTMPTEQRSRGEWRCMQPQRCQLCYKVFSNSGNLRQHVSNVHTPGQHVPCNFCARVFKNKEYLRKHHVQTHNVPLRRQRTSAAHTFHFRTM